MSETIKTRGPLCGAPVVVQIAEDGPFYDGPNCKPTRIRYEYDEPERLPPLTKCAGYDLNELRFMALLLRKHDIRPEELRSLVGDFGRVACIIDSERANIEKRMIEETLGEIVRCKDCKHRVAPSKMCSHPKAIGWDAIEPDDDDFCSCGERKEG